MLHRAFQCRGFVILAPPSVHNKPLKIISFCASCHQLSFLALPVGLFNCAVFSCGIQLIGFIAMWFSLSCQSSRDHLATPYHSTIRSSISIMCQGVLMDGAILPCGRSGLNARKTSHAQSSMRFCEPASFNCLPSVQQIKPSCVAPACPLKLYRAQLPALVWTRGRRVLSCQFVTTGVCSISQIISPAGSRQPG